LALELGKTTNKKRNGLSQSKVYRNEKQPIIKLSIKQKNQCILFLQNNTEGFIFKKKIEIEIK
jgi:hypothetical protein